MKIVVLDGYTLNPGDLSWSDMEELGNLKLYERSGPEEVVERVGSAEVVLTNKVVISASALSAMPQLKYIGVLASGYNIVDVDYATNAGIVVTNVPAYGTESVAQMAFALLLELARRVGHHSREVIRGRWAAGRDFCFWDFPQVDLSDKTIGIIGFGRIGRAAARIAHGFGMRVIANSRSRREPPDYPGFRWCEVEELMGEADVVSLHCPLLPETEGLVSRVSLELMKPSAFLINTSRGQLVVEQDLADALNEDLIAGAAVDVLPVEPPVARSPLYRAKNIIVTPHIAWATREARVRLMKTAVENLKAYLEGTAVNVVSALG